MPTRDTPGRPTPSGSRQQTRPDQTTQSGSPELDDKLTRAQKKPATYRDRPTDDGKHGDGSQEPTPRPK